MTELHPELVRQADCRHGPMRFYASDDTIGRSLEVYGEWAAAEIHLFEQLVRKGDTVVDAGANIGTHTVALGRLVGPHGRVHAFEPSPYSHGLLTANLVLNGLPSVQTHPVCLGAAEGSLSFPLVSPLEGTNMGAIGTYLNDLWPDCRRMECPVVTVDGLGLRRLDFMKIDVEGHELDVIDGAAQTIRANRPALFVEIINAVSTHVGLEGFAPAIMERLRPLGYSFWNYTTPLFNPDNWRGSAEDLFPNVWSFDMLCVPADRFVAVGMIDAESGSSRHILPGGWQSASVIRI